MTTEETATPVGAPVPAAFGERIPIPPVMPTKRSGFMSSRTVMISLGALAAVLIVTGVAAPQVIYLRDAGKYDVFRARAEQLSTQRSDVELRADAARLLQKQQADEANALAKRLRTIGGMPTEVLPAEQASAFTAAATALAGAFPKPQEVPREHSRALERRLAAEPQGAPASWFAVDVARMVDLSDLDPERDPAPEFPAHVSQESLDRVKREIRDTEQALDVSGGALSKQEAQIDASLDEARTALQVVDDFAASAPELARKLAPERSTDAVEPQTELEIEADRTATDLRVAAERAAAVAAATEFVRDSSGKLMPASEANGDAGPLVPMQLDPVVRSGLVLSRVEAYLAKAEQYAGQHAEAVAEAERESEMPVAPMPEQPLPDGGIVPDGGAPAPDPATPPVAPTPETPAQPVTPPEQPTPSPDPTPPAATEGAPAG